MSVVVIQIFNFIICIILGFHFGEKIIPIAIPIHPCKMQTLLHGLRESTQYLYDKDNIANEGVQRASE